MLYSVGTGYALRSLAAMPEDGTYVLSKDLASKLNLPGPYLAKVLKALTREGVLKSLRGPRGGYQLARAAQLITVSEVVSILNHAETMSACLTGCSACGCRDHACALRTAWGHAKDSLAQDLALITIRDLRDCARSAGPGTA